MPFLCFFLLLFCFLLAGYGILGLFQLGLGKTFTVTLSLLLGVALASLLPFLLQLMYIPITGAAIFGSLVFVALLLNIPTLIRIRKEGVRSFLRGLSPGPFRIKPYEVPYFMVLAFIVFVSVWRCYYLPPLSRDALSGPEAIAEFAVREHTLVNSFFNVDLWSTNNQFKSPFLISLQLIYKIAGFPFGQVWLSIVFISFTIFLYQALKEKLHPLLAATLLLLFTIAPEPYAYTFMILYDYSNMVFFFLGLYFLFNRATGDRQPGGSFYFAGLLLGIATYIRSETLALTLLFIPPILLIEKRAGHSLKKSIGASVLFLLPSMVGYYLPVQLYVQHYLPVHYDVAGLINRHPGDLSPLFRRYAGMFTQLLTGELSIHLWGYFYYLTAILFAAEARLLRRFNREARNWLYAMVVLFLGLGILGWLLPVMDLADTTKRELFKMLPLALFYLANNQWLLRCSAYISRWEQAGPAFRTSPASEVRTEPARTVLTKTGKTTTAPSG
ncbi:MAG TPA: hypothetical protein VNU72_00305, partial [Puia sp.]|nr:hypothetical protein [Puia sp.]